MSLALRILLMIFSVGFVYFVLKRIHKDQLRIQDSIFWILLSVLVLILAFFPQIAIGMAHLLRFYKDFLHGCEDQQFGGQNQ